MSLTRFMHPISRLGLTPPPPCPPDATVREAAQKMISARTHCLVIQSHDQAPQGLLDLQDLCRVMAKDGDTSAPLVSDLILAKPPEHRLPVILETAPLGMALARMDHNGPCALLVTDARGRPRGILTHRDILDRSTAEMNTALAPLFHGNEPHSLKGIHTALPGLLREAIYQGAPVDDLTGFIQSFSNQVLHRIMAESLEAKGPPPCEFVFLTMGSEGRGEQTLISDQDNALLFRDGTTDKENREAKIWFDDLSRKVCTRLDQAGFVFCTGKNMAMNPKWCQPMSVWKQYFSQWIRAASPRDLLHSGIFFDFKDGFGSKALAQELRDHLFEAIGSWSGFLRNMTENALEFRPPLGLFGKFQVAGQGDKKDTLDLKYAQLPIIDVTRIYALKYKIDTPHTPTRLFRLYTRHALTAREYQDILQSYQFLMELRFRRQITAVTDEGKPPDNDINPANLSHLDQQRLKDVFKLTEKFQQKLGIEFTGIA